MNRRGFKLIRWCFVSGMVFCASLAVFPGGTPLTQGAQSDVSVSVDCKETGRLNGEVGYQYDVTLTNNTDSKQKACYKVIFFAGSVPIKVHNHSTILIPKETSMESHDGKIKEEDWDRVTRFRIECESEPIK